MDGPNIIGLFIVVTGSVLGFIALVIVATIVLALVGSLVLQVIASPLSGGARAGWIALTVLVPVVGIALWYFFGPRPQPTDEERIIASNWFAELGHSA